MNRRTTRSLTVLIARYARTEAWLMTLVSDALASGDLWMVKYRRRIQEQAADILRQLDVVTRKDLDAFARSSYLAGREASGVPNKSLTKTDRDAIDAIATGLKDRLTDSNLAVKHRVDDAIRRAGLRAAAIGDRANRNVDMRQLRMGTTGFIDSSGRQWRLETYAFMTLKTMMMEAVNTGSENLILEVGGDLVQIAHKPDSKYVGDSLCDPHHEKLYSLTGASEGYPVMSVGDRPPFHPYCEHFIKQAPARARKLAVA